ncbi:sialate O-acetylesterase [Algibacter sp. L4_22]|uniref:sialate O-acetylesterase n=1 Tax=Algibacter sp. L4_22 TaxID=2942477 RepID=UPI00201B68C4|nr:sialate O-acetylesterase [Algibacter sp. L4_22]MCL5129585.1 sialate O-acetylesterase [Algibacter sp. L4_22]
MKKTISIIFLLFFVQSAFAFEITLPSIFADHMVLQRDQKVPVWGITEPNASVEVMFAGQKKVVQADAIGKWKVNLDPLMASSLSQTMTILSKLNDASFQLKILDVLVGEVWLCSGQSNMYRPFRMLIGKAVDSKYEPVAEFLRQEVLTANDPLFRQYKVGRDFSVFEEKTQGRGDWSKAIPKEVNEFSGTAYFFGKELRRELNVPVAIISCNLGGTKIEPWMPIKAFEENKSFKDFYDKEIAKYKEKLNDWDEDAVRIKDNKLLEAWQLKAEQAKLQNKKEPNKPKKTEHPSRDKQIPATLYNAMISPLIPYAIKGAIWYQGESNTGNSPEVYGSRLSAMVENWRSAWGQGDFYFYCCQLANYREPNKVPVADNDGWALVSNGQREILELPNTGLAVLNDIGEAKDIHPKNKMDVGKRLSLWAFKQAYNKDIVCSGPLYKTSEIKNNKIIIEFSHVGSGLMVGKKDLMKPTIEVNEPLKRFQICGINREWKWAQAKIIGKNSVEVWHKDIPNPVEVRYAWSSNPEGANLYNKEGLPASLFKTIN